MNEPVAPTVLVCPVCGKRYAPGFIYCPVDGAELPGALTNESAEPVSNASTVPRRARGGGSLRRIPHLSHWVVAALAAVMLGGVAFGVWWSYRPFELLVEFESSVAIQVGDRVYAGKSVVGSVGTVADDDGVRTVRVRVDSDFIPRLKKGTRCFALPEVPIISQRGLYLVLPAGEQAALGNRSRIEGETSYSEYLGLVAREKGLPDISGFTSGLDGLMMPSGRQD